jgi:hypothetical protein
MARKKEGGRPWRCGGAAGSVREGGRKGKGGHELVGWLGLPGYSGPKRPDGPAGHLADWAES